MGLPLSTIPLSHLMGINLKLSVTRGSAGFVKDRRVVKELQRGPSGRGTIKINEHIGLFAMGDEDRAFKNQGKEGRIRRVTYD